MTARAGLASAMKSVRRNMGVYSAKLPCARMRRPISLSPPSLRHARANVGCCRRAAAKQSISRPKNPSRQRTRPYAIALALRVRITTRERIRNHTPSTDAVNEVTGSAWKARKSTACAQDFVMLADGCSLGRMPLASSATLRSTHPDRAQSDTWPSREGTNYGRRRRESPPAHCKPR